MDNHRQVTHEVPAGRASRTHVADSPGTFAWQEPDPEPEGPGLAWRETGPDYWSGSWRSQPRDTVILESNGRWVAYIRLEDPPGLTPITTVGRFETVEEAHVADRRGVGIPLKRWPF